MNTSISKPINTLSWALRAAGCAWVAAFLAAYVGFVWLPVDHQKQLCQQRVAQLETLLAKAPQVRQENRALRAELVSLRQSVAETQRRLPKQLNENDFVDELRRIAAKLDIEVGEHQLGMVTDLESYSQAELTVYCQGSYASICQFLDEIDHLARITEISNLQIEGGDNFQSYPLQVTFVLYFGGSTHDRSMKGEVL